MVVVVVVKVVLVMAVVLLAVLTRIMKMIAAMCGHGADCKSYGCDDWWKLFSSGVIGWDISSDVVLCRVMTTLMTLTVPVYVVGVAKALAVMM